MKLNHKVNIISVFFIIISCIIIIPVLNHLSMKSYIELDKKVFEDLIYGKYIIIEEEFDNATKLIYDWSYWTSTYEYINDQNPTFIEDNMTIQSYEDYEIDYMAIFDEKMKLKYGAYYNAQVGQLEPIEAELIEVFKETGYDLGVIEYKDRYLFFSGAPINDNLKTKQDVGLYVFAYEFDEERIKQIQDLLDIDIQSEIVDSPIDNGDFVLIHQDNLSNHEISSYLRVTKEEKSYGKIVLPIINKSEKMKSVIFTMLLDNEIQEIGRTYNTQRIVVTFILMAIFGITISLLIRKLLLNRIVYLSKQVSGFSDVKMLSEQVEVTGKDEISDLALDINKMLVEMSKTHRELTWIAYHDELTGALNRRAGLEYLEKEIHSIQDAKTSLSIAYVDIDGLKIVNDKYGHIAGDQLIRDIYRFLETGVKDQGVITRLGGDEFMIIFRNAQATYIQEIFNNICEDINKSNMRNRHKHQITFSYGIAHYSSGKNSDSLIEEADEKMYRIKKCKKSHRK